MIDPSKFHRIDRSGEWSVTYEISGTVYDTVKAATADEAQSVARHIAGKGELELYPEDIDECRVGRVLPHPDMYLVTRDGRSMAVSRLEDGDVPREPHHYEVEAGNLVRAWEPAQ